jgi:hypothetical protein
MTLSFYDWDETNNTNFNGCGNDTTSRDARHVIIGLMPIPVLRASETIATHRACNEALFNTHLSLIRAGSNPELDFPVNAISGSDRRHLHALHMPG